ncbi:hypothetical protein GCM10009748_20860 [Agromyces lapidis]
MLFALMPTSGATCCGVMPSTSLYQSTSCHLVGSERNACAVVERSRASSVAASFVSGSSNDSSVSRFVSWRARPQLAAVLRIVVKRYGRNAAVGPLPARIAS